MLKHLKLLRKGIFGLGFGLILMPLLSWGLFLPGAEDIPLPRGLTPLLGGVSTFEAPSGRFVEVIAVGTLTQESVVLFYRRSLPSLGWHEVHQKGPSLLFSRETEQLRVGFEGKGGRLRVKFTLVP